MNLMFRKGFREQKTSAGRSPGAKGGGSRNANKRRDNGYSAIEEHHYRTHLFFSPQRSNYNTEENDEPRCGPVTGGAVLLSSPANESDSLQQQPLVIRTPSVWPSTPHNKSPANTPSRQPSFNNTNANARQLDTKLDNARYALSGLDRDCFIIPVHSLDRFLPEGVPVPVASQIGTLDNAIKTKAGLNILEIPDPKLCVLCHLMSHLEPIDPVLESPLVQPLAKQRSAATELLTDIAQSKTAVTGMLLANMERHNEFPFISYYIVNSSHTNPVQFYNNLRSASLTKFDPRVTRYSAAHTLDLYAEVASICRPPIRDSASELSKTHTPSTGYIVTVYKVFEGDDGEKFERNWLYWTGARMIYRYLPPGAGLRKITLHKSISSKGDKMYLLMCECASLLNDVSAAALLIPALRARLCGYTGLYRPLRTF